MTARPRVRLASLTGLFVALVLPAALSAGAGGLPLKGTPVEAVLLNEVVVWGLTLVVLAIVRFWERRPLASIGLVRPTWSAIFAGTGVTFGLLLLALMAGRLVQASGVSTEDEGQMQLVIDLPIWLQFFLALSAGFTEEVLFRGYAIERTTELTGRPWLGAIIPIFVFGAVHAPFWGLAHALVAGLSGLWLTLVYLWRRNLWTNITAHALLDGLVFVAVDLATAFGPTNV